MDSRAFYRRIFPIILIFVLGGLAYANTLHVPFYLDDFRNIQNNPLIRIVTFEFGGLFDAGFKSVISSRPVANITYALNYYIHYLDLPGYHLVNIGLHLLTGLLLFLVVKRTLMLPSLGHEEERASWIACAGALLWLLHPVHTQAVTYIVQRMTGLSAFFYLGSLWFYVEGRLSEKPKYAKAFLVGCLLFGFLALGSKENSFTLPIFILLYEWYFFRELDPRWLKKLAPYLVGFALVAIAGFMVITHGDPIGWLVRGYQSRSFTLAERVLTELRVVFYYIGLLIYPLPSRLGLEHDFSLSHSLFSPLTTLFSAVGLVGLCGIAMATARRHKLFSFALLWFLGNLVIESSVIPLELVFEHRLYLPTLFLMPALVLALSVIPRRLAVGAGLSAILLLLAFWTFERNATWNDPEKFLRQNIRLAPGNPRTYTHLGLFLLQKGRVDEAIALAEEAIRVNRNYLPAYISLGNGYAAKGWIPRAIQTYQQILQHNPRNVMALVNLGSLYGRQNHPAQAAEYFERAVTIDPNVIEVYYNLGLAYQSLGDSGKALAAFRRALAQNPQDTDAARKIRELGGNTRR